jgi:hypothetical protein
MNDITKKIRGYSRRQPVTEKKFKFSNDLLASATYVGNGKSADNRFDLATESLSIRILRTLNKKVWLIDKIKRLANLTRIQQEARLKGQCGVTIKAEE